MTDFNASDRDVTRAIRSWLHEDRHEDVSRIAAAVLDQVEATPRRRATWWPAWRTVDIMNKLVPLGLGAAAVVVALVIGTRLLGFSDSSGVGGAPSPEPTATRSPTPIGGTVQFHGDGVTSTTDVNAVADGASVSGTAVTTSGIGIHTVRLECAAEDGDTWAVGGTVEQTTLPGERAGPWSAVIVKDGSPQQIAIWLSDDKSEGIDCKRWLASIDFPWVSDPANGLLNPVDSGALVPPPDLAP